MLLVSCSYLIYPEGSPSRDVQILSQDYEIIEYCQFAWYFHNQILLCIEYCRIILDIIQCTILSVHLTLWYSNLLHLIYLLGLGRWFIWSAQENICVIQSGFSNKFWEISRKNARYFWGAEIWHLECMGAWKPPWSHSFAPPQMTSGWRQAVNPRRRSRFFCFFHL